MKIRASNTNEGGNPEDELTKEEIKQLESRNALMQYDAAKGVINSAIESSEKFFLTPKILCEINFLAVQGLKKDAGELRKCPVYIDGTTHAPPPHTEVATYVDELCDYVNSNWSMSPIHLCAYLMWRINWVHPFSDGNGRTSRVVSYMVLCIRLGFLLPGTNTIPIQIARNKPPYYAALDEADAAWANGNIDVSAMEELLSVLLARQLVDTHEQAKDGGEQDGNRNT